MFADRSAAAAPFKLTDYPAVGIQDESAADSWTQAAGSDSVGEGNSDLYLKLAVVKIEMDTTARVNDFETHASGVY